MRHSRKEQQAGAALVESCLAITMLCLILFGILQVSYLIAARDVISFTAFASARAVTVGMKPGFVDRVARTVSIPTAGPILHPTAFVDHSSVGGGSLGDMWDRALRSTPSSDQYWVEKNQIPNYLGALYDSDLDSILNYYNWLTPDSTITAATSDPDEISAYAGVRQYVPLAFPFAKAFFREDSGQIIRPELGGRVAREVPLYLIEQELQIENHSYLYLTGP